METRASFVIVGAFVLSFFIALVAAVVWLADLRVGDDTTRYDIFFQGSVTGLSVGSPVRYGGIPIGSVADMRISPDRFGEIQVIIDVPKDTPIREDAVARLESQGITGVGFIQINGGTESAPPLTARPGQERPEIRSEKSALQQVFENAPEIMQNLRTISEQATKLLNEDNIAHIQNTLANIDRFSGVLSESSEDVSLLLQEGAGMMEQVKRTTAEAERLVAAFADRADGIAGATEDTIMEARSLVQDLRGFTARMDGLALEVSPILDSANATMVNFSALGDDMRAQVTTVSNQLLVTIGRLDNTILQTDDRISGLLERAKASLENVDTLMQTATVRIDSVADTAEDTMGRYGDLASTISPMVNSVATDATKAVKDFSAISGELRAAAVSIAAAADEAALLIKENREPVTNFSNSGLYEFTQLLSEMRILVSSLSRITNQIERDPAQFFFGDSQRGYEVQ